MFKNNRHQPKTPFPQKLALIIFGACLFFVLLEIGLRLGGFVFTSLQEHRNRVSIRQKGTYRILCLGESTTAMQYPPYLEDVLNRKNMGVKFSVIDKGTIGANTTAILSGTQDNINQYKPDMVITMMGVNDFGQHIPYEAVNAPSAILFFKSFRVYKLNSLLWLHIVTKFKEFGAYKREDKKRPAALQSGFSIIGLKEAYAQQPDYSQTEESLKKAIELNPKDAQAYIKLGQFYKGEYKFPQAEEYFKKAVELDPKNAQAYTGLGWSYHEQRKFLQAEETYKKAIEIDPAYSSAYLELGIQYRWQRKFSQAEKYLNKALELGLNSITYLHLGLCYKAQDNFSQAEECFKKAINLDPASDDAYGALATLYEEKGDYKSAGECYGKANNLRLKYFNALTVRNYQKFREVLSGNKVQLVCVQYPMRSAEPLKKIFEGQEGIIFVDNEKVFKDAVKKDGYKEYFMDTFAGDFGHCTQKGNELLAQNIADTILNDYFKVYAKR